MSESAPIINPEDVFPRRNLPGEAEQWGRTVEDRTVELEKNAVAVNQSLRGANRGTAAQLAAISDQLKSVIRVETRGLWDNDRPYVISSSSGLSPQQEYPLNLITGIEGFNRAAITMQISTMGRLGDSTGSEPGFMIQDPSGVSLPFTDNTVGDFIIPGPGYLEGSDTVQTSKTIAVSIIVDTTNVSELQVIVAAGLRQSPPPASNRSVRLMVSANCTAILYNDL